MVKKKKMLVSFVLDETGSMLGVKEQTVSGFNEYIQTLKNEKNAKDIRFTLTQFNSEKVEVVHDGAKLKDVPNLTDETYRPDAMTPLYDAIGKTIRALETSMNSKKMSALVVIQTDGQENHSKDYNQQTIFKLIEDKKKEGWSFAFLGADQDAWLASQALGISRGSTMSYNSAQTKGAFRAVATATVIYAHSGGTQTNSFFSEQDEKASNTT